MLYNLLQRMKPEFRSELDSNIEEGYGDMVTKIKRWLKNASHFDSLTIHQVHCLVTFTNTTYHSVDTIELMYGTHWFYTNKEYDKILNTEVNTLKELK